MFTLIVKITDVGDRLGQYLQSRNASDSSDHVVKIADRLGQSVPIYRKNPRRRKIVKIRDSILRQVGTRLKLHAYELEIKAIKLLQSYLTNRKERTKINNSFSEWVDILIGKLYPKCQS